ARFSRSLSEELQPGHRSEAAMAGVPPRRYALESVTPVTFEQARFRAAWRNRPLAVEPWSILAHILLDRQGAAPFRPRQRTVTLTTPTDPFPDSQAGETIDHVAGDQPKELAVLPTPAGGAGTVRG